MQVTKITSPAETKAPAAHRLTDKQLYDEINYHRAEKLTKKMLEKGLITADVLCVQFRANIGLRKEASQ